MADRQLMRSIAAIAVPAVVTNITTPLLALSDVAILGHAGSAVLLAGIAVGGTMFNMLYWLFGFLRMGTSGLTAQAAGARCDTSTVLYQALIVAVGVGVAMIALQNVLCAAILGMIDADAMAAALAERYFRICVWGAPATLGTLALTGWCVGIQNARLPMYTSIFVNVLNIALSVWLVFGESLGIKGVAYGTLLAQWAGFMLALALIIRRYRPTRVKLERLCYGVGRFFRVNVDIMLRTVCLIAVTVWFTRTGATQGDVMLAVNVVLMQFFTLFSYFMDGLANAAEAIVGNCRGAGNRILENRSVRYLLCAGVIVAVVFTALYAGAGEWALSLLSDDADVVCAAREYTAWVVSVPLMAFMAFTWDGVYIGLAATRRMLLSMFLATGVYFAVYYLAFPHLGNHGLWLAFVCYLLTRGVALGIMYRYLPYSSR